MRAKILALLWVVVLVPGIAAAKPKARFFNAAPERVFAAAVAAAHENFVLGYADDQAMTVAFRTGISYTSNGFDCSLSVVPMGEGAEVVLNVQKIRQLFAWGEGDRIAEKVFKAIEENLGDQIPE